MLAQNVGVIWFCGVKGKTTSNIERDYQLYRAGIGDDDCIPADVLPDVVDDLEDIFTQEVV